MSLLSHFCQSTLTYNNRFFPIFRGFHILLYSYILIVDCIKLNLNFVVIDSFFSSIFMLNVAFLLGLNGNQIKILICLRLIELSAKKLYSNLPISNHVLNVWLNFCRFEFCFCQILHFLRFPVTYFYFCNT